MEADSGSRTGPGGNLSESIERTREEEEMADNKVVDRARQVVSDAVDSTRDIIDDGLDEARDRFEGAAEDLERNARRAQREVRRRAQRLGSAAREKYDAAAESVRAGYQRVRHDAAQVTDTVNVYVRENPGKSILIAAGVGFVIGLLVRGGRRRDD